MSQQSNKYQKRIRRKRYLQRKKDARNKPAAAQAAKAETAA